MARRDVGQGKGGEVEGKTVFRNLTRQLLSIAFDADDRSYENYQRQRIRAPSVLVGVQKRPLGGTTISTSGSKSAESRRRRAIAKAKIRAVAALSPAGAERGGARSPARSSGAMSDGLRLRR